MAASVGGAGSKGERLYDRAAARLPSMWEFDGDEPARKRWMPAHRSISKPDEMACYLACAPPTPSSSICSALPDAAQITRGAPRGLCSAPRPVPSVLQPAGTEVGTQERRG